MVFAFTDTTASKVVKRLAVKNKRYVESDVSSIEKFVSGLPPGFRVVGMGDYGGRDNDKLRIETKCNNKFRNKILTGKLQLTPFLKPGVNAKYAEGIGNSFCNLISHLMINRTRSEYAFIHIPKTFDVRSGVCEVEAMIKSVK